MLAGPRGRGASKPGLVLYWANRRKICWANVISVGQMLKIPVVQALGVQAPVVQAPVVQAWAPGGRAPRYSSPRVPARPFTWDHNPDAFTSPSANYIVLR